MTKSGIFFRITWSISFMLATFLMFYVFSWYDDIIIWILSVLLWLGLCLIGVNHFVGFNEKAKD